ncbi:MULTISPECIES: exosortase-dependent surface protein XDP2 [Spirulina sp. CCY15215]|uniref:exosortase-dependent surface protein XDP2 n=1 Tax=Spirulina sp. CCY15215 TaxID=2767591 RepID=UPI0019509E36|nr:exosortase-dependent surface protein XDP2 [Spirulina major]
MLAAPADAFTFTSNFTGDASKGDIWLQSIQLEDGSIVDSFSMITSANIVANDAYTGGNSGAASADRGDNTTTGVKVENATAADLVTNLSNLNLNNIVDTEDSGSFEIDLFFDKAIDNLLIWERGQNSALAVQALDENGALIGDKVVVDFRTLDKTAHYAGYSIDTLEIGGAQKVNSVGLTLADLGLTDASINSFRFFSEGGPDGYNGPDWKILGTQAEDVSVGVPEPGTVLGLTLISGLVAAARRKK